MKKKFYEVVIVHTEHIDNEIQIDFRTRRQAEKFCSKLMFQDQDDWEVYINYCDVKNGIFNEVKRVL